MPKIYLVRHGESTSNVSKIISGRHNHVPLTQTGHAQAKAAGLKLASSVQGPVHIVSSPLERAHHTAIHIARALKFPETQIEIEPDVIERSFGELEGTDTDLSKLPGYVLFDNKGRAIHANPNWKPNGGESLQDVQSRALPAIKRLKSKHPEKDIIVVSHGHTIKALLSSMTSSWGGIKRVNNAEIRELGEGYSVFFHSWRCDDCSHTWVAQDDDEGRRCHACPGMGRIFERKADHLIRQVLESRG